jgi:hypothetical protein
MDMQTGNQNYLLPRNSNVNNQQASPVKRIIYNDNNLVSYYSFDFQYNSLIILIVFVFID